MRPLQSNPVKNEMRKNAKKLAATLAACAMLGAMAVGGTFAYLTDNEEAVNTFTVGNVQIDLTEENYPGNSSDEVRNLVPNQEIAKDPKVINTGENDAIVFATVEVPVRDVTIVAADGTKGVMEPTELFWFKSAADAQGTFANNFNSKEWIELTDKETHGDGSGSTTTYVFAYRTALAQGSETEPLFDKIQLKNLMEGEVGGKSDDEKAIVIDPSQNIKVKSYAIQASEVLEGDSDLTDTLDSTTLGKIFEIYMNQADTTDTKNAD